MKIVFSLPGFDRNSNGLNVFHLIAREFKNLGAEVRIIPWNPVMGNTYEVPAQYEDLYSARFDLSDAIAFLPDAIPVEIANKIRSQTKFCVWWLCNVPGLLGHEPYPCYDNDILLSYSKLVSIDLPQFYYHADSIGLPPLSKIKASKREADLVLVYCGKGRVMPIPNRITDHLPQDRSKIIYISRFFPETKEVLYSLLSRARFVISFDPISHVNYEATLFGAPVFMVNHLRPELSFQKDFNIPLHGLFRYPEEFISTVKAGLDLDIIHNTHKAALDTNHERVKKVFYLLERIGSDFVSSGFDVRIGEIYRRLTLFELPTLRKSICPFVGSQREPSPHMVRYIKSCVESPEKIVFMPFEKKKEFWQRIKRSLLKKVKKFLDKHLEDI